MQLKIGIEKKGLDRREKKNLLVKKYCDSKTFFSFYLLKNFIEKQELRAHMALVTRQE